MAHPICGREEVLRAFLLGDLPEDEAAAVAEHLFTCPPCGAAAARLDGEADAVLLSLRRALRPAASNPAQPITDKIAEGCPETEAQVHATTPESVPAAGRLLGDYELLAEVGRGGMGVVYKARHVRLNRIVALKLVLSAEPSDEARFRREARALARLDHPHVVPIYEAGVFEGWPFFAEEFVEGGSLADRLRNGPQPPTEAAKLVRQLAQAVDWVHRRQIIHRDLKPANVLLAADGTPKIADFGLARMLDGATALTGTGSVLGTPEYMAPEQAAGKNREVGPAADVWALGVLLYEMLTGRTPFRADSALDTLAAVLFDPAVPPSRRRTEVPKALDWVCLKCLQKQPADRYASAEELADDLGRYLAGEPVRARPRSGVTALRRLRSRWRWLAGAAAGLTAVAIGLLLLLPRWLSTPATQPQPTPLQVAEGPSASRPPKRTEPQAPAPPTTPARPPKLRPTPRPADAPQAQKPTPPAPAPVYGDAKGTRTPAAGLGIAKPSLGIALRRAEAKGKPARRTPSWRGAIGEHLRAVACSPLRPIAASAGANGTIQLWDSAKGTKVREWVAHAGEVVAVAISPNGALVASAGRDGAVRLWDISTGAELFAAALKDGPTTLAFSASGSSLFAAGPRECVRVWDAKPNPGSWTRLEAIGGWLAISPDGQTLAVPGPEGRVSLRLLSSGQESFRLGEPGPIPQAAAYSPDGATLAVSRQGDITLWETATGERRGRLEVPGGGVRATVFGPDGWSLVTAGADGAVRLWALATGREVARFEGHSHPAAAIAFNGDGRRMATAGDDGLLLWHIDEITRLAVPDGEPLARADLESCWEALANSNAEAAYQATCILASSPAQSVPFIREVLRPVADVDARTLDALLALLASDNQATRAAAHHRLEELGELTEPRLRPALAGQLSPDLQKRLAELLKQRRRPIPAADQLQALRAIEVLERADSGTSTQLLAVLEEGAPNAPLTQRARMARKRMCLPLLYCEE
jgi:tRNA A-37 threonylcarbamoyl transferase component Bud32